MANPALDYSAAPVPVREDLQESQQRVWKHLGSPGSWFDGAERVATTQLTGNSLLDERPRIAGGGVVWQTSDTFDLEILFRDGTDVVRVTNNTADDTGAEISDDSIIWQGFDGQDFQVFLPQLP